MVICSIPAIRRLAKRVIESRLAGRKSTTMPLLTISNHGFFAEQLLSQVQAATVMGVTSRGVFLHLASTWVLFLSSEVYRGPLTLNFTGNSERWRQLKVGAPVRITSDSIHFPQAELVISMQPSARWEAPPRPQAFLSPPERRLRLEQVSLQFLEGHETNSFGALLEVLVTPQEKQKVHKDIVLPAVRNLLDSLRDGDISVVTEAVDAVLGRGVGLTPSGDDLVLGCLLSLNRWGDVLAPRLQVEVLNQAILPRAYRKTTTLSANLIECASQGQANERLILALDGILSGNADAPTCADYLAGWGHTSGTDALAGMALAM